MGERDETDRERTGRVDAGDIYTMRSSEFKLSWLTAEEMCSTLPHYARNTDTHLHSVGAESNQHCMTTLNS